MKIKNHYSWLCAIWIISTICDSISCVVNFVDGKLGVGFLFLVLAVSFAFVSGILLEKAISIYQHNQEVDLLKAIARELLEEEIASVQPFEEFKNE